MSNSAARSSPFVVPDRAIDLIDMLDKRERRQPPDPQSLLTEEGRLESYRAFYRRQLIDELLIAIKAKGN